MAEESLLKFSKADSHLCQTVLDLVKAGYTEVFAAKEFGFGFAGEFAKGLEAQTAKTSSSTYGQFQVIDGLVEYFIAGLVVTE